MAKSTLKDYLIIYHMGSDPDIEVNVKMRNDEEAIVYAKQYRKDGFSIFEKTKKGSRRI